MSCFSRRSVQATGPHNEAVHQRVCSELVVCFRGAPKTNTKQQMWVPLSSCICFDFDVHYIFVYSSPRLTQVVPAVAAGAFPASKHEVVFVVCVGAGRLE